MDQIDVEALRQAIGTAQFTGPARQLQQSDRTIGPGNTELAIGELDILNCRFENMAGDGLALFDDRRGGHPPR